MSIIIYLVIIKLYLEEISRIRVSILVDYQITRKVKCFHQNRSKLKPGGAITDTLIN